ncbi:hypothetical protein C8J34_1229 [Rhizobium sp. PP-F2F-G36]|nr:hypothetical protein C8J34_1229 [Rhizobium sp. PP-F2F-G36]
MNPMWSALMQTRCQYPLIFWGAIAVTAFAVLRMVVGGGIESATPSSIIATGPASYVSPYQLITPAAAAVPPVERIERPVREAAPSHLLPVKRPELDQADVGSKGLRPKPRPELEGLQVDPRSGAGVLRPVERPELRSLQGSTR